MKVLFYLYAMHIGGAENIVVQNILELKERQIDVVLVQDYRIDNYLTKKIDDAGIKTYYLYKKEASNAFQKIIRKLFYGIYTKKFKDILKKEKANIYHYHSFSKKVMNLGRKQYRYAFYTVHADAQRNYKLLAKNNKALLSYIKKGMTLVAVTESAKKQLCDLYHTNNVVIISNFIDVNTIISQKEKKDLVKKNLGIPVDSFIVGHVGRFHPVKNHERLIEIFETVRKKQNNAVLILIGGDYQNNMSRIINLVKEKGLDDYVHFLGVKEKPAFFMSCFDTFVLPSFSESFSLVALEAQALGIKCVLSEAVPQDVVCQNSERLSLDLSNVEWSNSILNSNYNTNIRDIKMFDIHSIISDEIRIYESKL